MILLKLNVLLSFYTSFIFILNYEILYTYQQYNLLGNTESEGDC